MEPCTIRETLLQAQSRLEQAGVPDPVTDARWLLSSVLNMNPMSLLLSGDRPLDPQQTEDYRLLIQKRCTRVPLQYLLGTQDFFGITLKVDSRVLIPRPETEQLCEKALELLKTMSCPTPHVLDLCTGSGAIAITIKKLYPNAKVLASDISAEALSLARENATLAEADVAFYEGDLFAALPKASAPFDLILSNPPYISTADYRALQPEVLHEPSIALEAGTDGLCFYRRIAEKAPDHLTPGGILLMELGFDEADAVRAMLAENRFERITVLKDYEGLDRMIYGYLSAPL